MSRVVGLWRCRLGMHIWRHPNVARGYWTHCRRCGANKVGT